MMNLLLSKRFLVKAANAGSTVTVVRVGGEKDTEALRTALAMGADDAILVEAD
jgi:electron transfer flavoprotein beta subunit